MKYRVSIAKTVVEHWEIEATGEHDARTLVEMINRGEKQLYAVAKPKDATEMGYGEALLAGPVDGWRI